MFSVNAKQLEKGHGYTIWLMVFNHPENCGGSDGPEDEELQFGQADHLDPETGFSLMYGAGGWALGANTSHALRGVPIEGGRCRSA